MMRNAHLTTVLVLALALGCVAEADDTADTSGELASPTRVAREGQHYADGVLTIDLAVANVTYHKVCAALVTADDWIWMTYEGARYVEPLDDGYERWRVELDAAEYRWVDTAATIEYALVCFFDGDPNAYWDNNGGADYRFDRSWPADVTELDTARVLRLAVSGGGELAMLDAGDGRTLAFYDADGDLVCTVDTGDYVSSLHWVDGPDLVLAESYGATWPARRWRAYSASGVLLWDIEAALEKLLPATPGDPSSRPLLVGTAGGAVVSRAAPTIAGPTGERCASFPVVTPGGRLYCEQARGVYQYYVYACGPAAELVYPPGTPWGADDDGHLVLASADRRALTGYDSAGNELWTATTDYLWTPYPVSGGSCTNAATGGVVAYTAGSWPAPTLVGLDIASGVEVFEVEVAGYGGACAHADGRYYMAGVYEMGLVRIDAAGGLARYDADYGISQLEVHPDGVVTAQVAGYREPYARTYPVRAVVLDDELVERLSRRVDVAYPPGPPVLARTGAFAAIAVGDSVARYAFE